MAYRARLNLIRCWHVMSGAKLVDLRTFCGILPSKVRIRYEGRHSRFWQGGAQAAGVRLTTAAATAAVGTHVT